MKFAQVATCTLAVCCAFGVIHCRVSSAGNDVRVNSSAGQPVTIAQAGVLEEVYARLKELEKQNLGVIYDNDLVTQRLDRLEKKIFASVQAGSPKQRLDRLLLSAGQSSGRSDSTGTSTGSRDSLSVSVPATTQPQTEFGSYETDLIRRIKRAWFPPKNAGVKHVQLVFKIHKGGELSDLRMEESAGLPAADRAALKAVENASPFRPLPVGAPQEITVSCGLAGSAVSVELRLTDRSYNAKTAAQIPAKDFIGNQFKGTDLTAYFRSAAGNFKAVWSPVGAPAKPAVIGFSINKTGALEDIDVTEQSSSSDFDDSAKRAVQTVKNLDPPPLKENIWTWAVFDGNSKDVVVGVPGNVDFTPYMASMQEKIKSGWNPPKSQRSKRITIQFKVDKTGQMSNLKITQSSEIAAADEAALRAARHANPLPPLPRGAPRDIDIQFTFDYNVKSKGSSEKSSDTASEDE